MPVDGCRQQQYEELLRITSSRENFKELKETLYQLSPPAIPYLGVFQTWVFCSGVRCLTLHRYLTFIEDGNPDIDAASGLVNFSKRRQISTIISRMQVWQQRPYSSANIVAEILDALQSLETKTDDQLFQYGPRLPLLFGSRLPLLFGSRIPSPCSFSLPCFSATTGFPCCVSRVDRGRCEILKVRMYNEYVIQNSHVIQSIYYNDNGGPTNEPTPSPYFPGLCPVSQEILQFRIF